MHKISPAQQRRRFVVDLRVPSPGRKKVLVRSSGFTGALDPLHRGGAPTGTAPLRDKAFGCGLPRGGALSWRHHALAKKVQLAGLSLQHADDVRELRPFCALAPPPPKRLNSPADPTRHTRLEASSLRQSSPRTRLAYPGPKDERQAITSCDQSFHSELHASLTDADVFFHDALLRTLKVPVASSCFKGPKCLVALPPASMVYPDGNPRICRAASGVVGS
eukprot:scaffold7381_cov310-Pinguiococcus_pyrenoidosus.AAC.137